MKLITIHPGKWKKEVKKYGYESSQLSRKKIADHLGWEYFYILTAPQIRENWKEGYKKIGFQSSEIINICNYQSDIGHDDLGVLPEDVIPKYPNGKINLINGFVASIEANEETMYFTSGLYLKKNKNNELEWYNKNGSVVLRARKYNPRREPTPIYIMTEQYLYYKDGMWLTDEDLLIKVLINLTDKNDIIIRDQHEIVHPKLWRFVENTNRNYYEYIHHNVLSSLVSNLRKKTKYLVASEMLTEVLQSQGYKVNFIPPMVIDKNLLVKTIRNSPRSYCYVGNMTENKRLEMVIQAFSSLYNTGIDVEVTLYGGDKQSIREKFIDITPNIKVAGYVDEVPYWEHDGYISASKRELFANACVEAMSFGLICILSNVDIAHRYYGHKNKDVILFDDIEGLIYTLKYLFYSENINTQNTIDFVEKYAIENVVESFLEL